jgi:hypothetical protein
MFKLETGWNNGAQRISGLDRQTVFKERIRWKKPVSLLPLIIE